MSEQGGTFMQMIGGVASEKCSSCQLVDLKMNEVWFGVHRLKSGVSQTKPPAGSDLPVRSWVKIPISPTACGLWWKVYFHPDLPGSHTNSQFLPLRPPLGRTTKTCFVLGQMGISAHHESHSTREGCDCDDWTLTKSQVKEKYAWSIREGSVHCQVLAPAVLSWSYSASPLWEIHLHWSPCSVGMTLFHLVDSWIFPPNYFIILLERIYFFQSGCFLIQELLLSLLRIKVKINFKLTLLVTGSYKNSWKNQKEVVNLFWEECNTEM